LIASSESARQIKLASTAILFRVLMVAVFSLLLVLGRGMLTVLDPSKSLLTYTTYVPLMLLAAGLDEILSAILQGKQRYQHMAVAQILRSVFRLGLTIFFLYGLNLGLMSLVYSWTISYGISVAYQYLVLPFSRRLLMDWHVLRTILRFGFPLQLNNFLWFASNSSQSLLLSIFLGPAAVAFFEVAMRVPGALLRLSQSYTAVYFPMATGLLAEGKRDQARRLLEHSLSLNSFLAGLAALISVVFHRQIVTLLFSEKYAASSSTFALLMLALHMTVLVTLMGYTLTAAGFPGRSLAANTIREGLMFLGSLVLIPVLGFGGPAYAKLAAFCVANPLSVWLLRKSRVDILVIPYIKQTALLWSIAAVFLLFQPESMLFGLAAVVLFFVLNVLWSTVTPDDIGLILPEFVKKRLGVQKKALDHS
jgi:O-antigen/teichoic acid export membrane protein